MSRGLVRIHPLFNDSRYTGRLVMKRFAILLLPLTLGAAPVPPPPALIAGPPEPPAFVVGPPDPQVTILHQRVVIRIPRMTMASRAQLPRWKEKKGPKCIEPGALAGAVVAAPQTIDLLLVDGGRMRAKLDSECRSADFYSGLYLKPGTDGRVCADRDAFRIRSGGRCEIDEFRRLSLKR